MSDFESDDDEPHGFGMFWGEAHSSDDEEAKPGARMPEKWRFLWKWFNALAHTLKPSERWRYDTDHVRIGREPHDWRIDVNFVEEMSRDDVPLEKILKRIRKIREAVLITTLFAEVDYETWLRELQLTSLFKPMHYMDIETHRLQRKFAMTYYGDFPAAWYSWERLQHFFGVDNFSQRFTSDLKKLAELAAAEGVDVYALQTIPFEIHVMVNQYCESYRPQQCEIVRNVHLTTKNIRSIENERITKQRSKRAPVFSIDEGIILNLRSMEIRSRLLEEIRRLVDSAVHVKHLVLPALWAGGEDNSEDDDSDDEGARTNDYNGDDNDPDDLVHDSIDYWVPLARSLTGNAGFRTRVSGLVLPTWYCREPLLTALCSGLATARDLKFLRLEAYMEESFFTKRVSWRAWAWLGYALFNKSSTSSVEALSLAGFELNDENLDSLEEAMLAEDPLAYLWQELTNPGEGFVCNEPSSRPHVEIVPKAKLDLYDSNSVSDDEYIEAPRWTQGIAMDDGPLVDVLIPGFGFCRVDRPNIVHKKQRLSSARPSSRLNGPNLKTLLLDFRTQYHEDDPLDADSFLPRLLDIVGKSLTSLGIVADDVGDSSLLAGLEKCQHLENLSLGGMTLKSMDPVMELYYLGVKLSSIELHDLTVPIEKFDYFLKQLEEDDYLYRLRVGERFGQRLRTTTAEAMQFALESNTQLEYVHLHYSDYFTGNPSNPLRKWNCEKFNKQPLILPLDEKSRLAFLKVLHSEASKLDANPRNRLSEETIEHIFEFAASTTRRMVIEKLDSGFRLGRYV